MAVYRIYVEKKPEFAVEASQLKSEINDVLRIPSVTGVRIINRYDTEGLSREDYLKAIPVVYMEPQLDLSYEKLPEAGSVFAVEYLPGQFDQRAASCEECAQLLCRCPRPTVRTARVYALNGDISADELSRIKKYLINPVEAREASLDEKNTLRESYPAPDDVEVISGFTSLSDEEISRMAQSLGLAMNADDLMFCRA